MLILVSHFHTLTAHSYLSNYMFQRNVAIIRFLVHVRSQHRGMNMQMSQRNDFKHVLEPDDGHIALKHVVRKITVSCECMKVTDKNQQDCKTELSVVFKRSWSYCSNVFTNERTDMKTNR
jgi:hypothetical protein